MEGGAQDAEEEGTQGKEEETTKDDNIDIAQARRCKEVANEAIPRKVHNPDH